MSNKKRIPIEIQQEYGQVSAKAGSVQYQISELKKDLVLLNEQMRELNFEFAGAKRAEEEAAKKATVEADKGAADQQAPALEGLK